jgi:glutamate-1-semialdehyde 2,1-aminomutase
MGNSVTRCFDRSLELTERLHAVIPGGAHTYAKGDDQYPVDTLPVLTRGLGCRVWDADGNEYIEYGMGLRAVALGHAFAPVLEAAARRLPLGSNFGRPTVIELEAAEALLQMVGGDMVKFAKNGSDAVNAAVRLARAYTGRSRVAICAEHPFFSTADWFIGTTPMDAGIPEAISRLTLKFHYNDLASLEALFAGPGGDDIAAVVMEAETITRPEPGFLSSLAALCRARGALLILDESITGFRWHNGGARAFYNLDPDLVVYGKALGNGFAISALVGRRDIMELGGIRDKRPRVFLLSTTHGAEPQSLAAACEVIRTYQEQPIVETLWRQGERLATGIRQVVTAAGLDGYFEVVGQPCNLVYIARDQDRQPSQAFRTLFLRETLLRGLLMPSLVVSSAHDDAAIDMTVSRIGEALEIYNRALDQGPERFLPGRPVQPVMRRFSESALVSSPTGI